MNNSENKPTLKYVCDYEACVKRFANSKGLKVHQRIHLKYLSKGPTAFKFVDSQKGHPSSPLGPVSTDFLDTVLSSPVEAAGSDPASSPDFMSTLMDKVSRKRPIPNVQQAPSQEVSPMEESVTLHQRRHVVLRPGTSYISCTATLMAFGVVHHTALNVVICAECRTAILPDHVVSHAKEKHKLSPGMVTHERFQAELATLTLARHVEDIPLPAPFGPPVEILEVVEGHRCTMDGCHHCCPLKESVTRHQRKDHRIPSQRHQVAKSSIQNVISSARSYFPVNPTLALPSSSAFEKLMRDVIPNLPKPPPAQPITFRDVTPFHGIMRWWEHLEQFNVKDEATRKNIIELVSVPKPADAVLFRVVSLVHYYFDAATKFVNTVGFAVRQAIMDQDEKYWRELHSDSARKYANETIQAVSACIRFVRGSHLAYKLPMNPKRIKITLLLLDALRKECDTADINRVPALGHLHLLIQTFWEDPNAGLVGELEIFWFSYLCASSVRRDGNLSDAGDFASDVSTLKYSLRIFIVNDIPQGVDGLDSILKFIKKAREKYMDPNSSQPYNLLKIRSAYASAVDLSTPRPPRLFWDDSVGRCTIDDKTVVMSRLKSGVQFITEKGIDLIERLTGSSDVDPWFSTPIADTIREGRAGYSFLEDERFHNGYHTTLRRLVEDSEWRIGGVDNQGKFFWNAGAAVKFLGVSHQLRQVFAQIHIVASTGSNRRLTELEGTSFRNSASRLRTLVFMQEELVNISLYSKNSNTSGHDTFLPTILPDVFRNLLVAYLVKIRPIECLIANFLYGEEAYSVYNTYLYVDSGKRMTSEKIGEASEAFFLEHLQIHLTNAQFRQFQASLCNEFIDEVALMLQDRPLARGMGHQGETHRNRYALSHEARDWLTDEQLRDQKVIDRHYQTLVGSTLGDIPIAKRLRKEMVNHAAVNAVNALEAKLDQRLQRLEEAQLTVIKNVLERQTAAITEALTMLPRTYGPALEHPSIPDTNTRRLLASTVQRPVIQSPAGEDTDSTDNWMNEDIGTSEGLGLYSPIPHQTDVGSDIPSQHTQDTLPSPPPTSKCFNPPMDLSTPNIMSSFSLPSSGHVADVFTPFQIPQEPLSFTESFRSSDATPPSRLGNLSPLPRGANDLFQQHSSQVYHHVRAPRASPQPSISSQAGAYTDRALTGLRMIYGRDASFNSPEQEQIIRAALAVETNFLAVMPTGGGKSAAWLVASALEGTDSKTFVVVPFAELLEQHFTCAKDLKLRAHLWTSNSHTISNKNLIFISAEAATTELFMHQVEDLITAGEAKRLFFDEAQEGYNTHEKRNLQRLFDRISHLNIQRGLFSATVPLRFERTLLKNFKLTHPSTVIIRAVAARPEICYHVISLPRTHPRTFTAADAAIDMTQVLKHHMRTKERMIIFVRTIDLANDIASALKCAKYHSGLPRDGENKRFFMHQWLSGAKKIIVATPALIQGVDYPAVRFTIFVENAYGAMGFIQGSGRGGRNGNRSDSFLLVDTRITEVDVDGPDLQGRDALDAFQADGHCRAGELSKYCDGKNNITCQDIEGQIPCDTCNPEDLFQGVALRAALQGYTEAKRFYIAVAHLLYADPRDVGPRSPPPRGSSLPILSLDEEMAPLVSPAAASATASTKRSCGDMSDELWGSSEVWNSDALRQLDEAEHAAISKRPRISYGQNALDSTSNAFRAAEDQTSRVQRGSQALNSQALTRFPTLSGTSSSQHRSEASYSQTLSRAQNLHAQSQASTSRALSLAVNSQPRSQGANSQPQSQASSLQTRSQVNAPVPTSSQVSVRSGHHGFNQSAPLGAMMNVEHIDISGAGFSPVGPPSDDPSQPPRYTQPYVIWDPPSQGNPWSTLAAREAAQGASQSPSMGGPQVGVAITAQAVANMEPILHKKKVVSILNTFLTTIEYFCPVCFMLHGIHSGQLIDHTPLVHCPRLKHGGEEMYDIYFRTWKKSVSLPGNYQFCFYCGSPQEQQHDGVEPAAHLLWSGSGKKRNTCPFIGLIFLALYAVWFDRTLLKKLRGDGFPFPVRILDMTLEQYGKWLGAVDVDGRYWNGLELLIFRLEGAGWPTLPVTTGGV